jgi:hypothetical protein
MSSAGQKKGIYGARAAWPLGYSRQALCEIHSNRTGVSPIDRCYEPSGENLLLRFQSRRRYSGAFGIVDHEIVIGVLGRNNLKNRPN